MERTAVTPNHSELARYIAAHAIRRGEFQLVSGRSSSYYCDCKQVSLAPEGALLIADAVLFEIRDLEVDAVGGMDMGATPIVSAVALRSFQNGRPMPTFVVRKESKEHGTMKRVEGLLPEHPSRVAIVDDVVTSAGSIVQAIDVIRGLGHDVVLAISVLDREAGGAEVLAGKGVPYRPLVRASELGLDDGGGAGEGS